MGKLTDTPEVRQVLELIDGRLAYHRNKLEQEDSDANHAATRGKIAELKTLTKTIEAT